MLKLKFIYCFILISCFVLGNVQAQDRTIDQLNNEAVRQAKDGHIGEAMLKLEQCMRAYGFDKNICRSNITEFRKEINLAEYNPFVFGMSNGIGYYLSFLPSFVLPCLIVIFALAGFFFTYRKQYRSAGTMFLLGFLMSYGFYAVQKYLHAEQLAIIMKQTKSYQKPYEMGKEGPVVFAGQIVKVLSEYEGFAEVETELYDKTWLPIESIQAIRRPLE